MPLAFQRAMVHTGEVILWVRATPLPVGREVVRSVGLDLIQHLQERYISRGNG